MEFPTIVYKTPGVHACPGGTYNYKGADDQEALDELVSAGWFLSLPEAVVGKAVMSGVEIDEADDEGKPTRSELEAKATELHIKFDGRTTDRKLSGLIDKALEDKEE